MWNVIFLMRSCSALVVYINFMTVIFCQEIFAGTGNFADTRPRPRITGSALIYLMIRVFHTGAATCGSGMRGCAALRQSMALRRFFLPEGEPEHEPGRCRFAGGFDRN